MNPAQKAVAKTKTFVQNHRVAIAIVTTAAATTAITVKMQKDGVEKLNEFLEKHNLTDEFYSTKA